MSQPSLFAELDARDAVLGGFEGTRRSWLRLMRALAREIVQDQGTVSTDDLRAVLVRHPELEPEGSRNVFGCVFKGREWRAVGWKHSEVRGSHGNRITVWELNHSREGLR